jgi:hypothetical protein
VPIRLLTALFFAAVAASAFGQGQGPQKMTFRNNLFPGQLTRHRLSRVIQRRCQRKKHGELLEYRRQAEWSQCNVEGARPGEVTVYQMMVDQPPEVVRVLHDKKKVKPTPTAEQFNLSPASTRLQSAIVRPQDAPAQVPLTDLAEKTVLLTVLDFAHWPRGRVQSGQRWERNLEGTNFSGKQSFELVDLGTVDGEVVARVTLFVQGKFTGALEREYVFDKAQAIIQWSRLQRCLSKMEAQAFYQRRRGGAPEEFKLKLDVDLLQVRMLTEGQQESVKAELTVFAEALQKQREGREREARDLCRQFRKNWPGSTWLPAVEELVAQMSPKQTQAKRYSAAEVKEALDKMIIAYEAATANDEYDLLERTRRGLAELADEYHSTVKKLAQDDDDNVRGRAVFALAFGKQAKDWESVQKATRDQAPSVRAMALAGFAARASPETSPQLLLRLLDDEQAVVRRRACEAVAACVPREHYSVGRLVEKIDHLMIFDKSDAVRLAAVRAIAAIGAPADVPKFEKALTHELNPRIREEIHKAIERVQTKS